MSESEALADDGQQGQLGIPSSTPYRRTTPSCASTVTAASDTMPMVTANNSAGNGPLFARFLAKASRTPPPSTQTQAREHDVGATGNNVGRKLFSSEANSSQSSIHKIPHFEPKDVNDSSQNNNNIVIVDAGDTSEHDNDIDNELFPMHQNYEICETIDDSMLGLHDFAPTTITATTTSSSMSTNTGTDTTAPTCTNTHHSFDYDWILDGTDSESEMESVLFPNDTTIISTQQRHGRHKSSRRELGDDALDTMLGRLELESSASSYDAPEEEMIEFGDFSNADLIENGVVFERVNDDDDDDVKDALVVHNSAERKDEEEVVGNCSIEETDSIVSTGLIPQSTLQASDTYGMILSSTTNASGENDDGDEGIPECKPPQSIECLVSDLDAELDAAIANCLHSPPEKSSDSEESALQDGYDCAHLLEADKVEMSHQMHMPSFQQTLLMSSILLEALPLPMPTSISDDPVASFTRRIQKYHKELQEEICHNIDVNQSTVQIQDEQLEQQLSDTIHNGYFNNVEEDANDYFDRIVMEELLNVPWPFHVIDLNETFLNDEDSDDPDIDEKSIDELHFDTYISNRLTELDFAAGHIIDCLLSRVYHQEDAINEAVENIFAAEMTISTSILYSNSCKEFLHRARRGYQLSNIQHDLGGQHDIIAASLDIVRLADNKDRLQYLMATIDEISAICNKENQWLQDVTTNVIAHHRFKEILHDAKRLKDMVPREEVLNHVNCLFPMRARLNRLHEVLLERVEESLAHLFSRILQYKENNVVAFDECRLEYESILDAWLSCFRIMMCDDQLAQQNQVRAIETAWSACIIKILSFEAKKAVACSIIDSRPQELPTNNSDENSATEEIQMLLSQTRFNLTAESTLVSLSQRLMRLQSENHSGKLSSPFFHLGSRLVELMNMYEMTLHWLETIISRANAANEPMRFILPLENGAFQSDNSLLSSVSSEKRLTSADEESNEEPVNEETAPNPLPDNIQFERYHCSSTLDEYKIVQKATNGIRRALWEHCESALSQLVTFYSAQDTKATLGESTDSATRNFNSTYDVLLQFSTFSSYFLGEVEENVPKQCVALESELSKVYLKHLRSVHAEAMTTTGTNLRHEAWHLAPLELPKSTTMTSEKNCTCIHSQQNCAFCKDAIIKSVYQAVGDLLLSSMHKNTKSDHRRLITERSEISGYRHLSSFGFFLDNSAQNHSDTLQQTPWQVQGCGITSNEFVSAILSFVEMNACGERTISILTQSSSNGLVRWTTRLLAIGNALPLVAKDASAAVMKLIDLYILTVFRFCAGSKSAEDVLIGFGRGTAANSAATSASVSLTMEADAIAPLPRERRAFVETQGFITSSRSRLKDIVNLDKFQSSSNMCLTSPRSKNDVSIFAMRLETEAAAAFSCFFVAMLVDVASTIFHGEKDHFTQHLKPLWADLKDMVTSSEKYEDCNDLKEYAEMFIAVVPKFVVQTTRFAAVNSLSGKELIFQVMCCGRSYENQNMQEHSNAYVDSLCERSARLWGYLSSSTRLTPPALHYTWNHLVWSAFMLLLEGFSKVNCSMEGRSLMSMDLATLSHGLMPDTVLAELDDDFSGIVPPPQTCREEMLRYVDTFIKVFYLPNEDILSWIKGNAKDYHLDHSISLVTSKASGSKDKNFITQGKQAIDVIYCDLAR